MKIVTGLMFIGLIIWSFFDEHYSKIMLEFSLLVFMINMLITCVLSAIYQYTCKGKMILIFFNLLPVLFILPSIIFVLYHPSNEHVTGLLIAVCAIFAIHMMTDIYLGIFFNHHPSLYQHRLYVTPYTPRTPRPRVQGTPRAPRTPTVPGTPKIPRTPRPSPRKEIEFETIDLDERPLVGTPTFKVTPPPGQMTNARQMTPMSPMMIAPSAPVMSRSDFLTVPTFNFPMSYENKTDDGRV